jgi:hypothetical protein
MRAEAKARILEINVKRNFKRYLEGKTWLSIKYSVWKEEMNIIPRILSQSIY